MISLLRTLKLTALHSVKRMGGYGVIGGSRWRRQRLLILAYHGVSQDDEHEWNGALYMSPTMLEERLAILRDARCAILPFAEAVERLYAGTLEDRSVAITFDDGYYDFLSRAFPLLQKYDVPPTVYLPTIRVGWNVPVFPLILSYMLWRASQPRVHVPEVRDEPFAVATPDERAAATEEIQKTAKRLGWSQADREAVIRSIAAQLSFDYDAVVRKRLFQVLTAEEIGSLAARGVDFQLHTHSHNTPRDRARFVQEIELNARRIEAMTGVQPHHFCYPSGNYDALFLPWLEELGVRSATTCDPGLASPARPPLMLPRFVDTSTTSAIEFHGWATGATPLLSRRRSYAQRAS
jgi:peptidoglycan/xylan/chitin deacetylase (PgdA/CDA1 family)